MADEEKTVPTIILKLTDPISFNVEIDIQAPLYCARAILNEATETIRKMIALEEAKQIRGLLRPPIVGLGRPQ